MPNPLGGPVYSSLWAKSNPHHTLWSHLIEVGSVAAYVADHVMGAHWLRILAKRLSLTPHETRYLVVWLAALHTSTTPARQPEISHSKPLPPGDASRPKYTLPTTQSWRTLA
jgi:hypothetical protein